MPTQVRVCWKTVTVPAPRRSKRLSRNDERRPCSRARLSIRSIQIGAVRHLIAQVGQLVPAVGQPPHARCVVQPQSAPRQPCLIGRCVDFLTIERGGEPLVGDSPPSILFPVLKHRIGPARIRPQHKSSNADGAPEGSRQGNRPARHERKKAAPQSRCGAPLPLITPCGDSWRTLPRATARACGGPRSQNRRCRGCTRPRLRRVRAGTLR